MNITIDVSFEKPDNEEAIAVHLVPVLPFPDKRKQRAKHSMNLVVIGAQYDDSKGWSFLDFSQEEKEILGSKLLEMGVQPLQWCWCVFSSEEPHE